MTIFVWIRETSAFDSLESFHNTGLDLVNLEGHLLRFKWRGVAVCMYSQFSWCVFDERPSRRNSSINEVSIQFSFQMWEVSEAGRDKTRELYRIFTVRTLWNFLLGKSRGILVSLALKGLSHSVAKTYKQGHCEFICDLPKESASVDFSQLKRKWSKTFSLITLRWIED